MGFHELDKLQHFKPVTCYTAENMKPIYGMLRMSSVKKELKDFFQVYEITR